MLKISSNPALTSVQEFRPAVAPLIINQDLGTLAFLDLSLNNLATLTSDSCPIHAQCPIMSMQIV